MDSGAQALKLDLSAFDLILTDFNLPDITGMELLERIRSNCGTPVIMVTGRKRRPDRGRGDPQGGDGLRREVRRLPVHNPAGRRENLTVAKLYKENEKLRAELERALEEKRRKNAQLEESLKMVEELAATDALTGLYNRRHFNRVLDQLFAESDRMDSDLSCVMIDLDGYKQLNDSFGHAVGDQVLSVGGKGDLRQHAEDGRGRTVRGRRDSYCFCPTHPRRKPATSRSASGMNSDKVRRSCFGGMNR